MLRLRSTISLDHKKKCPQYLLRALRSSPAIGVAFFTLSMDRAANAQTAGISPSDILSPKELSQRTLRDKPTREYQGLPFEGWMLYPKLFVGATYDDNLFQSSFQRKSAWGLRLKPALVAERDSGIHRTIAYANGDIRIFPDSSTGNVVNAQAGVNHAWEVRRDFKLAAGFEYDRITDMYNTGVLVTPTMPFGFLLPGVRGPQASPQRYNQFVGSLSGLKSFDRFFVGFGVKSIGTTYDELYSATGAVSQGYRDNVATAVTGRFGYAITPLVYSFVEGTGNFRRFNASLYDSDGYRAVAGIGTDRISLLRGEIYAGYQRQLYESPLFTSPSSPVVGGKLSWFPTRAWTISAAVDQTFQDSGLTTIGNLTGSAARVVSASTTINYAMSRSWSATVLGGYDDLSYISGVRHDHRWRAGAAVNYEITRGLFATLDYTFVNVNSNVLGGSFTRSAVALGATYKY